MVQEKCVCFRNPPLIAFTLPFLSLPCIPQPAPSHAAPASPGTVRPRQRSVNATDAGLEAVFLLGGGDMRRSLNILQATTLASGPDGQLDEEAVYATTGQPRPKDVEQVAQWLLNETFEGAYDKVVALQVERGLALVDIVRGLLTFVFRLNIPPVRWAFLRV